MGIEPKLHPLVAVALSCWSCTSVSKTPEACTKPTQITNGPVAEVAPVSSPDGNWLAFEYFSPNQPNSPQIWLMPSKGHFREAVPLVGGGNEYAGEFSWSPDSQWISYMSHALMPGEVGNQIYKINVRTREIVQLTRLPDRTALGDSTTWSKDGRIAFEMDGDIYVVSDRGGDPKRLLAIGSRNPSMDPSGIGWSPNGTRICFSNRTDRENVGKSNLWLIEVGTGRLIQLTNYHNDGWPRWIDDESLVFSRTIRLDPKLGSEVSVFSLSLKTGQATRLTNGAIDLVTSVSPSKQIVFFSRLKSPRNSDEHSGFLQGFHIWKCELNGIRD